MCKGTEATGTRLSQLELKVIDRLGRRVRELCFRMMGSFQGTGDTDPASSRVYFLKQFALDLNKAIAHPGEAPKL